MRRNTSGFPLSAQPAGLGVIAFWFAAGAALLAFFFLPWRRWVLVLLALWALLVWAAVWLAFSNLRVDLKNGQLIVRHGHIFPVELFFRAEAITEFSSAVSPLLLHLNCRVVLLRTPGRWFVLPALSQADFETLRTALRR